MKAYRIIVSGVVQGVGFRYHTREEARRLGLCGTVENLADGTVLIWVEGKEVPLLDFLKWCHRGPSTSKVQQLDYEIVNSSHFKNFEIKR